MIWTIGDDYLASQTGSTPKMGATPISNLCQYFSDRGFLASTAFCNASQAGPNLCRSATMFRALERGSLATPQVVLVMHPSTGHLYNARPCMTRPNQLLLVLTLALSSRPSQSTRKFLDQRHGIRGHNFQNGSK